MKMGHHFKMLAFSLQAFRLMLTSWVSATKCSGLKHDGAWQMWEASFLSVASLSSVAQSSFSWLTASRWDEILTFCTPPGNRQPVRGSTVAAGIGLPLLLGAVKPSRCLRKSRPAWAKGEVVDVHRDVFSLAHETAGVESRHLGELLELGLHFGNQLFCR